MTLGGASREKSMNREGDSKLGIEPSLEGHLDPSFGLFRKILAIDRDRSCSLRTKSGDSHTRHEEFRLVFVDRRDGRYDAGSEHLVDGRLVHHVDEFRTPPAPHDPGTEAGGKDRL